MTCQFHECIGHGCHQVIIGMMATFTNVFVWSPTPGSMRRQLTSCPLWSPGPLLGCFHNRCACFDRPLPIITPYTVGYISMLSPLYSKTYFASGFFCHVVKIHTSRWLEHGTWPGCFVNLEMVCTIFPRDTRTPVSCRVLCQVM